MTAIVKGVARCARTRATVVRLYRFRVHGRWHYVGTQADARAQKRDTGATWEEIDVPVGKVELIAFLNDNPDGIGRQLRVDQLVSPASRRL